MSAGTVTVGGRKYAVGLYWENSPGSGRVAQIAKEAARQPGAQADFYVVRPGSKDGRIPQFGLASAENGFKAGMPVLAGCLANQIPGSWVGAFRLNEGTVVTVVRDDLIVPDGDLFFYDETEARDRLIQEIGFGGLQSTYAPESWSIPGADNIPLTLLVNNRQDIKLQQVNIPQKVKIAAAAAFLVFILILAGVWYWQASEDEENARLEALRQAQSHLLPGTQAPPEPKYDRKWEQAPVPLGVVGSCEHGLAKIPAALAGWKLSTLHCSGNDISLTWTREKGLTTLLPNAKINDNGNSATQTVKLQDLKPRGSEFLGDPDDTLKRYLEQGWPGMIARVADDPAPPAPPGYTGPWNPPPAPWVKRSFTLTVPELPGSLPVYLGGLPGVVITSMNFTPSGIDGSWVIEGVIYENRK
jgi:hypothetical protein